MHFLDERSYLKIVHKWVIIVTFSLRACDKATMFMQLFLCILFPYSNSFSSLKTEGKPASGGKIFKVYAALCITSRSTGWTLCMDIYFTLLLCFYLQNWWRKAASGRLKTHFNLQWTTQWGLQTHHQREWITLCLVSLSSLRWMWSAGCSSSGSGIPRPGWTGSTSITWCWRTRWPLSLSHSRGATSLWVGINANRACD